MDIEILVPPEDVLRIVLFLSGPPRPARPARSAVWEGTPHVRKRQYLYLEVHGSWKYLAECNLDYDSHHGRPSQPSRRLTARKGHQEQWPGSPRVGGTN